MTKSFWKKHKCKISDFGFSISEMDEIIRFTLSIIKTSKANTKYMQCCQCRLSILTFALECCYC